MLGVLGHVGLEGRFGSVSEAWATSLGVLEEAAGSDALCRQMSTMVEVGRFTIPPPGMPQREFQPLHIDFGLPFGTFRGIDVARYTALYVEPTLQPSGAETRLVPIRQLFAQRQWPMARQFAAGLRQRFAADGAEGILARVVEAVDATNELPDKQSDGFLCGMEFATLSHEEQFFDDHGLPLAGSEIRVRLAPGEVLLFDNLAVAHGRAGRRQTHELHQLCLGFRQARPEDQDKVLGHFLGHLRTSSRLQSRLEKSSQPG